MAYTTKTLLELQQSLADRHDAGVLPTSSTVLTYWTRLLNRAKDYCADRLRLQTSTSLTTSSKTIALPTDFILANDVVDADNQKYTLISSLDADGATGYVYWITGDQTSGYYLNTPDDKTYTVYYTYRPADMSSNTDKCVIPDPEAVVARAYGMLRMAETDPLEDADRSFLECDRRLDEVSSQAVINDGGIQFVLPSNA